MKVLQSGEEISVSEGLTQEDIDRLDYLDAGILFLWLSPHIPQEVKSYMWKAMKGIKGSKACEMYKLLQESAFLDSLNLTPSAARGGEANEEGGS